MSVLQAFALGLLQGLTEFLPVSSSGHLVIVPWLLGWPHASLTFDTLVHWGTLTAVLLYFRSEVVFYTKAAWTSLRRRSLDVPGARVAWAIALGTLPGALAGVLLEDLFENLFHAPKAAAAFLLVTAGLLVTSEWVGQRVRTLEHMRLVDGLLIGIGQALAITPGISRSGATMAAGLMRGYRREDAARFSFLLGIPLIFGAGLMQLVKLLTATTQAEPVSVLLVGFLTAAVSGFLAIHWLLGYVRRHSLYLFALYCLLLGGGVLLFG
ncbi:MAG: undecaprenyl-diphosphatase UppP [Chloroflexi bacterium]|nr:undecaprenyl-diphosphatase UppP [Chloroflexota bacterium]